VYLRQDCSGSYDTATAYYDWDFGDETAYVHGGYPTHTYAAPGVYTVALRCGNMLEYSEWETKIGYVTIYGALFSADKVSVLPQENITFTDESIGGSPTVITSWLWDFGDGTTSSAQSPVHAYSSVGTYTVSLTISDGSKSDTITKTNYITASNDINANFTQDVVSIIEGESITFTDLSSGVITSWLWDFGDGSTSTDENPNHVYSKSGTYTVSLTASGLGVTDDIVKVDLISVYEASQAQFSADSTLIVVGDTVTFTNESEGSYDSFEWDFGDGSTSTDENPTHTYSVRGQYSVTLAIDGLGGAHTVTKTDYIKVYTQASADFSADVILVGVGDTITFTDSSIGDYNSWSWDFGDSGVSYVQNPTHQYSGVGVYSGALSVSGLGSSDTETKTNYITVLEPLVANFTSDKVINDNTAIQFLNTTSGDYSSVEWDFGDGSTSTDENPTHTYTSVGRYSVTLTVSGSLGVKSKLGDNYIYIPVLAPIANFSASKTVIATGKNVAFTNTTSNSYSSVEWDFGDGSTSVAVNPNHVYTIEDDYTVTLTTNGIYSSDTETKEDYITVISNPVVGFFRSDTPVFEGTPIYFFNQVSEASGSLAYKWFFGDGIISYEPNPVHAYAKEGEYTVILVVTSDGNGVGSYRDTVLVSGDDSESGEALQYYATNSDRVILKSNTGNNYILDYKIIKIYLTYNSIRTLIYDGASETGLNYYKTGLGVVVRTYTDRSYTFKFFPAFTVEYYDGIMEFEFAYHNSDYDYSSLFSTKTLYKYSSYLWWVEIILS
jgi:PKD repeat protein